MLKHIEVFIIGLLSTIVVIDIGVIYLWHNIMKSLRDKPKCKTNYRTLSEKR